VGPGHIGDPFRAVLPHPARLLVLQLAAFDAVHFGDFLLQLGRIEGLARKLSTPARDASTISSLPALPETMRMGRSWKRSDPRNSAISSRLVASSSTRSATRKSRGLKECLACTLASGDRHGLHVPSLHDLDEHLANLGVVFQQ
jgi:hypothetical protein